MPGTNKFCCHPFASNQTMNETILWSSRVHYFSLSTPKAYNIRAYTFTNSDVKKTTRRNKATTHLRVATKEEAPPLVHTLERQRRRRPVIYSHAVIVHPGCLADDVVPCGWPSLLALSLQPFNQRALVHQRLGASALGLQGISHTAETEDEDGRQQCKVRSQMTNRAETSPCSVLWCTCGDQQRAIHLSG